jgi:hypothetical protein
VLGTNYNRPVEAKESVNESIPLVPDRSSKWYHPFNFLAQEYGNNLEKMMTRVNGILALGLTANFIKNKKAKAIIRGLQVGLGAALFTTDLVMHVRHYIKSQKEDLITPHIRRMIQACRALGIKEGHPRYGDLNNKELYCGTSMLKWIMSQPKTEVVILKTYYNMTDFTEIQSVDLNKNGHIGIVMEFKGHKFLWDFYIVINEESTMGLERSFLTGEYGNLFLELEKALLFEYTKSLNYKESILFFDGFGSLYAKPRRKVLENINQFDIKDLTQEMIEVLNKKRKRAYAFIGRQGVGKSSILRVIEEQLTDYMIFHLLPEDFEYANRIRQRFDIIKMFQPAIVMIEDIDACGIKEKNGPTGAFLSSIDEVNKTLTSLF